MSQKLTILLLFCGGFFSTATVFSQAQSCPANINFSGNDLSLWSARIGLANGIFQDYPAPNTGILSIPEYSIAGTGIQLISTQEQDIYGQFAAIPVINGYSYGSSVKVGSTLTSFNTTLSINTPIGFTRSISYAIDVPAGPVTVPYTITYAYALVMESALHSPGRGPSFSVTLVDDDTIVPCASLGSHIPVFSDVGISGIPGALLDTARALANGFTNSPVLYLSHTGPHSTGVLLQDVWTKSWTENTIDLALYRGHRVILKFETVNCKDGEHFGYAYVALRNSCGGPEITGITSACTGNSLTYSIPVLPGGSYSWTVPTGWTISAGNNTNVITVTPGNTDGIITVRERSTCYTYRDTIAVTSLPPTVAGQVMSDNTVCSGTNSTLLTLNGTVGNIINWISSTDGANWTSINNTTPGYTAQNLTETTQYRALVQNGGGCKIDTSIAATIVVNPKTEGGILSPASVNICAGENSIPVFTLTGNKGGVVNWQSSNDNINWTDFLPVKTDAVYSVSSINATTQYRVIVKSDACPAEVSDIAVINYFPSPFPDAAIDPILPICYGKSVVLNATVAIGTSYTWTNTGSLSNTGDGTIGSLPFTIDAVATPLTSSDYVLSVMNAGCPNPFKDTFHVQVAPEIIVFAGNDTTVVAGQPLQLQAIVADPAANIFTWAPASGLDHFNVYNPVAILDDSRESITYTVRASNAAGCYAEDDIKVTVFKTGPEIFVPSGFTPNNDGLNDKIIPVCVGIKQLNFFRIYSRWGTMVFNTSEMGKGWDGTINGQRQNTGNFVYMAQGVDYNGKIIFKKGNITLIR